MDILQAIDTRISVRAFTDEPLSASDFSRIKEAVEELNELVGVHFQLYGAADNPGSLTLKKAMFATPAPYYLALVAPNTKLGAEFAGYYGEKLVLLAQRMGLGTCWVAGTFDRSSVVAEVGPDEYLHDVIPLGHPCEKQPIKQRTIRAAVRKNHKDAAALSDTDVDYDQAPEWFKAGMRAVEKAPSAVDEQPVVFSLRADEVTAEVHKSKTDLIYTDLGIAKLHFELGCQRKGTWEWGSPAKIVFA
jgi:hypothetical protein